MKLKREIKIKSKFVSTFWGLISWNIFPSEGTANSERIFFFCSWDEFPLKTILSAIQILLANLSSLIKIHVLIWSHEYYILYISRTQNTFIGMSGQNQVWNGIRFSLQNSVVFRFPVKLFTWGVRMSLQNSIHFARRKNF